MTDFHYLRSWLDGALFQAGDAKETQVLVKLRSFVELHGRVGIGREIVGGTGHITASAHIENRAGDKVLLVFSAQEQRWKRPGGHIEVDAFQTAFFEASRAVGREVESGGPEIYGVEERVIPEYWNTPAHLHFEIVFRFVADEVGELPRGARWYDLEEAARLLRASGEVG